MHLLREHIAVNGKVQLFGKKVDVGVCVERLGRGRNWVTFENISLIPGHQTEPKVSMGSLRDDYQSATYLQKQIAASIPEAAWGKPKNGLRAKLRALAKRSSALLPPMMVPAVELLPPSRLAAWILFHPSLATMQLLLHCN